MTDSQAVALHRRAIVIDGHSDILIPVADGLCHLGKRASIPEPDEWSGLPGFQAATRPTPYQLSDYATWFGCAGQYDVPTFQQGGVTAQVVAIYIADSYLNRPVERALSLISALHREIASNPDQLLLVRTHADIEMAKAAAKTGLILSFEGAEPLGSTLEYLEAYYALGLRLVGLSHSRRNLWADGTQVDTQTGGLTSQGRALVKRLNQLGIVIDLAHLSDNGFWEVLELSTAPPIVSHTSFTQYYHGYRAPWTEPSAATGTSKLRALAAQGGVVGIIFWGQPDIKSVVDDILRALDHAGDDHVGLGSDLFSREQAPAGLADIGALPRLTEALLRRGLRDDSVLKILGQNWLRVFREVIG